MLKYSLMMVGCITLLFCFLAGCVSISYEASGETGEAVIHYGKIYQNYTITFENTGNVPLTDIVFNVTRQYNSFNPPTLFGEETKQIMFDNVPPHTTRVNSTQFTYPLLDLGTKYTHELVLISKSS